MKKFQFLLLAIIAIINTGVIHAQKKEKSALKFKDAYFENQNNEKITERHLGEEYIYLVLETQNAVGKKVTIDVDEEDGDFIYKRKFLSVNYNIQVKIKNNIHKIKLEIFDPANKKHQKFKKRTEKKRKKKAEKKRKKEEKPK